MCFKKNFSTKQISHNKNPQVFRLIWQLGRHDRLGLLLTMCLHSSTHIVFNFNYHQLTSHAAMSQCDLQCIVHRKSPRLLVIYTICILYYNYTIKGTQTLPEHQIDGCTLCVPTCLHRAWCARNKTCVPFVLCTPCVPPI